MPNIAVINKQTYQVIRNYWSDNIPDNNDNIIYMIIPDGIDPDRIILQVNEDIITIIEDPNVAIEKNAFAMNIIRQERNIKLQQTDWIFCGDSVVSPTSKEKWAEYRQQLRNIPNTIDPSNISSIVWPSPPS